MERIGTDDRPLNDRIERILGTVGQRIRRARRERDMTLEDLAEAAGISVAHLSRVEAGARQPSLDGLMGLALSLGVPLLEFLEEPEEPEPGTVVRGATAPVFEHWGLRFQPLVPEAGPEGLVAIKVRFPADHVGNEHHDPQAHDGQEWLYMLKGRLRLTLGTERIILEPGDAAFFNAQLPHRFDVFSKEDVEVLMVSCVPCTHGGFPAHRRHPFREGHRGFDQSDAKVVSDDSEP